MIKKTGGKPMNSIETKNKERDILRNIALRIIYDYKDFPLVLETESVDSYYQQSSHNSVTCLRTFAFNTIAELRTELMELWQCEEFMHEFIPVVLASAFKERPTVNEDCKPMCEHKDGDNENILPTYTYTM